MSVLLIRAGIDSEYGHWNAPFEPLKKEFVYATIPENFENLPGQEYLYDTFLPDLKIFSERRELTLVKDPDNRPYSMP
jgi:hypothetical protein